MVNLGLAIAVPLYIWPALNAWNPLFNAITSNPNTTFNIIINPDSGPGSNPIDPSIVSGVAKLNSYNNTNLFGYVHVSYGQRNITDVKLDVSAYSKWANNRNADIHVDGIFLDEAPYDLKELSYMKNVSKYIKSTMAKHGLVWTNPGIPIDEAFYEIADYVNAYENSYADWSANGGNASVPECLRSRSTVIIHDYKGGDAQLLKDTKAVVAAGYNATYITSSSGYEAFGSDWKQFAADVNGLRNTKVKTLPSCCD